MTLSMCLGHQVRIHQVYQAWKGHSGKHMQMILYVCNKMYQILKYQMHTYTLPLQYKYLMYHHPSWILVGFLFFEKTTTKALVCNAAVYFPNAHKEGIILPGLFPGGGPRWSAEGGGPTKINGGNSWFP